MYKKGKDNFWGGKMVLVTGHEGFLGSWLVKALLNREARIIGVDKVKNRPVSVLGNLRRYITCIKGNIVNFKLIKDIIEKYKPQVIFHLAAESIVGSALKGPIKSFKSNIQGTWNVLEALREKNFVEAVIVASSDKAYGEDEGLPYKEDTPLRATFPYDTSKACADLLARSYSYTYNLPVGITRCGNVFGPGDFHFSRIVPDTIRSALKDRVLLIRSDGRYIRDYVYVEDVIDGYILLAEKLKKLKLYGEAFNFSNENPLSVLKLMRIIYKILDKEPKYKILNQAQGEIRRQYLSARKARRILGWRARYSLEEGLKKTIEWYEGIFK